VISVKTLLRYFKPHIKLFVIDMICALTAAVIDLAFPIASRQAMYNLLPNRAFRAFYTLMGIFLLAYAVRVWCYYIMAYLAHTFGIRVEADIRADLFNHLQTLDFDFYDKTRTGTPWS